MFVFKLGYLTGAFEEDRVAGQEAGKGKGGVREKEF
jgi:hypothetical protein